MAERLPQSGVVLADEVGTGKTRSACAEVHAVLEAGGRAAVVVPHGLMHQWTAESRKLRANIPAPKELTTFTEFLREVSPNEASWKDFSPCPDESEPLRVPEAGVVDDHTRGKITNSEIPVEEVSGQLLAQDGARLVRRRYQAELRRGGRSQAR